MLTLISIFRDSIHYVDRYVQQITDLRDNIATCVVVAEGDSTDGTYQFLRDCPVIDDVLKVDHGGPTFRSVDNPVRWGQIAFVYNALLDHIDPNGPVVLVESDLIWRPKTILGLLKHLGTGIDAIAPLSVKKIGDPYTNQGEYFYDSWGHRWPDGTKFPSDLEQIVGDGRMLRPLSSAGSCIAMKEAVARKARFGETDGIVGFGADLHRLGFTLYLDDQLRVEHP